MKTLEAKFKIVTPMFIGGADQTPNDGIRPPSVKGVLRFWWRALQWHHALAEANENSINALKKSHHREASLFGHAADENKGGQGQFLLRVTDEKPERNGNQYSYPGHKYLFGQGLNNRGCLSGGTFSVNILFRPDVKRMEQKEVAQSLMALGLLGGLGSRSRRGAGSVAITKLIGADDAKVPENISEYRIALTWLGLPSGERDLPPFSAFSKLSRMDCSLIGNNVMDLLNQIGVEMMRYRGYGLLNPGTGCHEVIGRNAEQNFPGDHDEMLGAVQGITPTILPCRAVFGLPHNYFFKSEFDKLKKAKKEELLTAGNNEMDAERWAKKYAQKRAAAELAPSTEGRTRRASPLLIHAHQFADNEVAMIQTLLPATFLPTGEQITIKANRLQGGERKVSVRSNWDTINTYLDRFTDRTTLLGEGT